MFVAFALCSTSTIALSAELIGTSHTVRAGDASEDWTLRHNGSPANLTVTPGGKTGFIYSFGSAVSLDGATVTGGSRDGLAIRNGSYAHVTGSRITSDRYAVSLSDVAGEPGINYEERADIFDSELVGFTAGALVRRNGTLNLAGSQVVGSGSTANGIDLGTGTVNVSGGSRITGMASGISIINGDTGDYVSRGRHVSIDNSLVEGVNGAAISVKGTADLGTDVDITISNGSTLKGGNGNILEVDEFSVLDATVDNSALEGNVVVENGGIANIAFQNNASLKGLMTGVGSASLDTGSAWQMTGDSDVNDLSLNGGSVHISDLTGGNFNTLTVGSLTGNGTFYMATDIDASDNDKLVVTDAGGASGDHLIHVRNTGAEPTTPNHLILVETNGGDAIFSAYGGKVDIGVYSYELARIGDTWRLIGGDGSVTPLPEPEFPDDCTPGVDCPVDPDPDPEPDPQPELSKSAQTVIGLHAASANVWYAETGSLRQRMGDVRMGRGENGLWGRTYGRGFKGNGASGADFDQNIWGLQAGAEREVNLGGIPIILGAFGGYSNSTVKIDGGSEGDIDSGYGGIYATWLGNDGLYVDGLFKINRFSNEAGVVMSDGTGASGDYSATAFGGQIEVGKTFNFANGFYAEPFIQLAALRIGSFDYGLTNGMHTDGEAYESLQGRIGATFGYNHKLENGSTLQPYVRLAIAQEFADNNKLKINTVQFNNAFDGTRGEVGAGFAYKLNDAVQIHADVDFSGGKDVDRNWGGNFGLSYKF
ncbi:autotransporter outer membrane beta-barrel domain-containing protein [Brucella anthropi]|uniref:autotransporter outer membrane beta-barrel domain-containing protein n=1 Tax=Brucella anthropi TaxID=529 RepID=UPI00187BD293|nr:autotransporter outer membrane beta-barrel domain-containing protein [Brucella anthropi]